METTRKYSELIQIPTFIERFEYLKLDGEIGAVTFGYDRYLNQILYNSSEWNDTRRVIILRDDGCDLAMKDRPIGGKVYIHHINPITIEDILYRRDCVFDPEYLICCSFKTHNAIHYGNASLLYSDPVVRTPNDTCPWRK